MNDEQHEKTAELWRKLISRKVATSDEAASERTLGERQSAILALADRARPWILPPQNGRTLETTALLRQWQPAWTQDLKNSAFWKAASEQIARMRQMIMNGELDEVDWHIRDIFIRCVPAVRKLALEGFPVRASPREIPAQTADRSETDTKPDNFESSKKELIDLLDWLESQ
jgi:hypothetical protein